MPWGRREGQARLRQTELILQREELRIQDLERTMMMDIRKAVRAAETGVERVNIAQLRSRLSREEYELEKAKFEAGLSTSRLVLDAQQRADQARVSEFMAFVRVEERLVGAPARPGNLALHLRDRHAATAVRVRFEERGDVHSPPS